jgi:hypothetical protein
MKPLTPVKIFVLLLTAAPLWAHHSFAAEYDGNKPVTIKGTFTKMDWVNPHSWVYVDVKKPDGTVENWACETAPPNGLYRRGWRKSALKEGDVITVEGFMAKDGSHVMSARAVITAEGKRMFAGTADDGAPPDKQ